MPAIRSRDGSNFKYHCGDAILISRESHKADFLEEGRVNETLLFSVVLSIGTRNMRLRRECDCSLSGRHDALLSQRGGASADYKNGVRSNP